MQSSSSSSGVGLGTVIAAVISFAQWKSVQWAILHGICSWIYVILWALGYTDSRPF